MARQRFLSDESGAATIDWVVVMAVMVGLGVAVSDSTDAALTTESRIIETELQGSLFETAWDSQLAVRPDATAGTSCIGGTSCDPGSGLFTGATTSGGGTGTGTGTGTGSGSGTGSGTGTGTGGSTGGGGTGTGGTGSTATGTGTGGTATGTGTGGTATGTGTGGTATGSTGTGTGTGGTGTGTGTGGGATTPPATGPQPASPPVAGCPSTEYFGTPIVSDGSDLSNSSDFQVRFSGFTNIVWCFGLPLRFAHFDANPTFTLTLSNTQNFNYLQVDVEEAACDTVLLVRDAAGNYHFDNNGGTGKLSRLRLDNTADLEGRVDVWLGVRRGGSCDARVEIRTG